MRRPFPPFCLTRADQESCVVLCVRSIIDKNFVLSEMSGLQKKFVILDLQLYELCKYGGIFPPCLIVSLSCYFYCWREKMAQSPNLCLHSSFLYFSVIAEIGDI